MKHRIRLTEFGTRLVSSMYGIRNGAFVLVALILIPTGLFLGTREVPSTAELQYVEYSSDSRYFGAVVPASCNSSPPVNHSGDCPFLIEVNLAPSYNNVTHSINPKTIPVGGTVTWSSGGGATKCKSGWSTGWLNTSGSTQIPISGSFRFWCTDGVVWSTPDTITVSY